MQLALYQPDIPQNLGTIMRLCACLNVRCHVIEPCGFPLDDKRMKRAGMDYLDLVDWQRHASWDAFLAFASDQKSRLILMTTKVKTPYTSVTYSERDILLMGRESAGVPESVAAACDLRVTIPMTEGTRSINVAVAAAIALGEMRRQHPLP